jgi:hypothetical protein
MASGAEFAVPLRTTALIRRMLVTRRRSPEAQRVPDHRDWVIIDRGPAGWRQAIGTGRLIVMTDGKRRRGTSTQV